MGKENIQNIPSTTMLMWKTYMRFVGVRTKIFRPVAMALNFLRITPNMVSFWGVLFMLFFAFFINSNLDLAIFFFILGLMSDTIDGPLARYRLKASDKGKFVDMVCDVTVFSIFMFGISNYGLLPFYLSGIFVIVMVFDQLFRCVINSYYFKSDWLFKAVAGFLPNFFIFVLYLMFVIYLIFPFKNFYLIPAFFTTWLFFDALYFFIKILRK